MKIVSWNVGGGYVFNISGPIISGKITSREDIKTIITFLEQENPDVIMLQEMHLHHDGSLPFKELRNRLGYLYSAQSLLHTSHIDKNYHISLITFSRFPVIEHEFTLFPEYDVKEIDLSGKNYKYFHKGILWTKLKTIAGELLLGNIHTTPFHIFKRSYEDNVLKTHVLDLQKCLLSQTSDYALIAGDFNFGNIKKLFPELIGNDKLYREILEGVKTNIRDDVQKEHCLLTHPLSFSSVRIVDTIGTDHFPMIIELPL